MPARCDPCYRAERRRDSCLLQLLYATGLRVSELLRLSVTDIGEQPPPAASHHTIEILRKGRKPGYVVAPASLVDETNGYRSGLRRAWLRRARRNGRTTDTSPLFINARGAPAGKNAYQRAVSSAGQACGFKATTHLLRATFACMLLARLEHLANEGANVNPLVVVKILLGHEHVETTDRYLHPTLEFLKKRRGNRRAVPAHEQRPELRERLTRRRGA